MKGKRYAWSLLGLFIIHSDTFLPSSFDVRYSLVQDEIHVEYGSMKSFDPYQYLLENRHALSQANQLHFPIRGAVDVKKLGEYDITYAQDLKLHVVVEDTTAPSVSLSALSLTQNESFEWDEKTLKAIVQDLNDNETDSQTLSERFHCDDVDTTKSGAQKVQCQTEDNSGNQAVALLSVQVNAKTAGRSKVSTPVITRSSETADRSISTTSNTTVIPQAAYSATEMRQIREVAILINQIRTEHGLSPLTLEIGKYHQVGYIRALEVASKYSHTRPNGKPCYTVFSDYGLSFQSSGENIARGQQSARQVVNDWMNSPAHRANILRPEFTYIVIGVTGNGTNKYWIQEFFS